MLNKTYVSLEGLGHFKDTVIVSKINSNDSYTPVPAGTKAKSYNVYYKEVSGVKVKANPQPAEGTTLPGSTYWVLGSGSPNDETRAASPSAVKDYVDTAVFGAMAAAY